MKRVLSFVKAVTLSICFKYLIWYEQSLKFLISIKNLLRTTPRSQSYRLPLWSLPFLNAKTMVNGASTKAGVQENQFGQKLRTVRLRRAGLIKSTVYLLCARDHMCLYQIVNQYDVSFTTYEESVESICSICYFSVQYGDCVIKFSSVQTRIRLSIWYSWRIKDIN